MYKWRVTTLNDLRQDVLKLNWYDVKTIKWNMLQSIFFVISLQRYKHEAWQTSFTDVNDCITEYSFWIDMVCQL